MSIWSADFDYVFFGRDADHVPHPLAEMMDVRLFNDRNSDYASRRQFSDVKGTGLFVQRHRRWRDETSREYGGRSDTERKIFNVCASNCCSFVNS